MKQARANSPAVEDRFLASWREDCRVPEEVTVLAAVSGGADSTALLCLLAENAERLQIRVQAVHVHHGLRGREADEDAAFVAELGRILGVPVEILRVSVEKERRKGESLEEAARRVRYREMAVLAQVVGAWCIASGHTADDLVETVLFHLARGSGPLGLAGIRPVVRLAGVMVIRPLLQVWHEELCRCLRSRGRSWREDSSNRDPAFTRNRIRGELVPWMEKNLNPAARKNIARLARIIAEEEEWIGDITANLLQSCSDAAGRPVVSLLRTVPYAARRRVIAALLRLYGAPVTWHNIERILDLMEGSRAGRRSDLGQGWLAVRDGDTLVLTPPGGGEPVAFHYEHVPGSQTPIPEAGLMLSSEWVRSGEEGVPRVRGRVGEYPAEVYLNGRRCSDAKFVVRTWQPGDRIRAVGAPGSRKLQDIFTDMKVPRKDRWRVPVLECDGEVVWVAGYRPAAKWTAKGGRMLRLRVERLQSGGYHRGSGVDF